MADKASKAETHYRPGTEDRHCAICSMFRKPNSCTAVGGKIYPEDLCDYFRRSVHYERVQTKHEPKDGVRYERVARQHRLPPGAHRLPAHVVKALGRRGDGKFDPHRAGEMVDHLFPNATMIEDGTEPPDILIPAATVAALGNGNPEAGRRVLDKWAEMLREPDKI